MMFPLENNAEKSVKNFKTKVQAKACTITKRSHNLDDDLITQVNRIVRGTANYLTLGKQNLGEPAYVPWPTPASVQARNVDMFRHCRIK